MHSGRQWDTVTTKIERALALGQPTDVEIVEADETRVVLLLVVEGTEEAIRKIKEKVEE